VPEIDANGNLTNKPSAVQTFQPIGDSNWFRGTFDGKGHTISGIYVDRNAGYTALFGRIEKETTVKNLVVKNSYIRQSGAGNAWIGSIIGFSYGGTVSNVYSNAIVVANGAQMGGMIGRAEGTVSQCWFDGIMKCTNTTEGYKGIGGVVGVSHCGGAKYDLTMTNCLNTGEVCWNIASDVDLGLGGIYGGTMSDTPNLTITNCINAGNVHTDGTTKVGAIVGSICKANTKYTIENCYTTTESGVLEILGNDTASAAGSAVVSSYALAESAITGAALYSNEEISLDFDVWTARSNDVPALTYFVGKVVAEADTVAKTTE
jgi:hypothetical protein